MIRPRRGSLSLSLVLIAGAWVGCGDAEKEAAAEALSVTDVSAYWSVRGQDEEKNNYIRPVVRFRVVNGGTSDVGYVQAMAVFKRSSFPDEGWGSDFLYTISEEPIAAGGQSDLVTMRCDSNFISKDPPEVMFQNAEWEDVLVEIFLRVGPSSWKLATDLSVTKRIGAPGLEKFLNPDNAAITEPDQQPESSDSNATVQSPDPSPVPKP